MIGDGEYPGVRTTRIEKLRDSSLRRSCCRESAIEDVSLTVEGRGGRRDSDGDAGDHIRESEALEIRSNQPEPCRVVRSGLRRTAEDVRRPFDWRARTGASASALPHPVPAVHHTRARPVAGSQRADAPRRAVRNPSTHMMHGGASEETRRMDGAGPPLAPTARIGPPRPRTGLRSPRVRAPPDLHTSRSPGRPGVRAAWDRHR